MIPFLFLEPHGDWVSGSRRRQLAFGASQGHSKLFDRSDRENFPIDFTVLHLPLVRSN